MTSCTAYRTHIVPFLLNSSRAALHSSSSKRYQHYALFTYIISDIQYILAIYTFGRFRTPPSMLHSVLTDTFSAKEPSLVKYLKQLQYEMHTSARHDTHLLREALGQNIPMKQRTAAQWSVHEGHNVSIL